MNEQEEAEKEDDDVKAQSSRLHQDEVLKKKKKVVALHGKNSLSSLRALWRCKSVLLSAHAHLIVIGLVISDRQ